jgi:uncharacterized protein (DUF2126 family)
MTAAAAISDRGYRLTLRGERRLARFEARGHTPGTYEPPPEFPLTLDVRRPAGLH